jgi:hypothetical protein
VHWLSFPIGFCIFFLIFSNVGAIAQKLPVLPSQGLWAAASFLPEALKENTARVFFMLMGLVTQVFGGGIAGNLMHQYEGYAVLSL